MNDTATVTPAKHIHEVREITFQEYAALLATRELLRNGDVAYSDSCIAYPGEHTFNMRSSGATHRCGTVGCIGGYMAFIMGRQPQKYVGGNGRITSNWYRDDIPENQPASISFQKLFYPPADSDSYTAEWGWITPEIAVQAIDNWLKTGDPLWRKLKAAVDAAEAHDNAAKALLALSDPFPTLGAKKPARKVAKKPARKVAKKPARKGVRKSPRY